MAGSGSAFCGHNTPPLWASLSLKFSELPGCEQPRLAFGTAGCADATAVVARIKKAVAVPCATRPMRKKRLRNGRGSHASEPRADNQPRSTTPAAPSSRSEEHTSELKSQFHLVCRLQLEK